MLMVLLLMARRRQDAHAQMHHMHALDPRLTTHLLSHNSFITAVNPSKAELVRGFSMHLAQYLNFVCSYVIRVFRASRAELAVVARKSCVCASSIRDLPAACCERVLCASAYVSITSRSTLLRRATVGANECTSVSDKRPRLHHLSASTTTSASSVALGVSVPLLPPPSPLPVRRRHTHIHTHTHTRSSQHA